MYVCMYIYVCIYIYICMYTYIYIDGAGELQLDLG